MTAIAGNRVSRGLGLLALVVLTLGLAGCGSDEPAAVTPPAPPPAPPPFQPQPVEVALGELGGTVTLMTTEAGGFTLNGEAFEGGEVTAENGNTYALSLADGQWTAAYQAATATLTLGITGEEVTVMRAEDGTYWIGDEAFEPGGNFAASNGNHYMLALADDGSWTASYVPATTAVTLGITGEEVSVMRAEDGSYHIGDTAFSSGGSVTATNGNEYTLTMADGILDCGIRTAGPAGGSRQFGPERAVHAARERDLDGGAPDTRRAAGDVGRAGAAGHRDVLRRAAGRRHVADQLRAEAGSGDAGHQRPDRDGREGRERDVVPQRRAVHERRGRGGRLRLVHADAGIGRHLDGGLQRGSDRGHPRHFRRHGHGGDGRGRLLHPRWRPVRFGRRGDGGQRQRVLS